MNKKKWLAVLAAFVFALACALWASQSASASRGPNVVSATTSTAAAQTAALRYSCPTGDGNASWGDAKMCTDAQGARFHFRDKTTDGFCVRVRYWSADRSSWDQTGPAACVTGQWVTFTDCCAKLCSPNARLYRDDGAYFTMPTNYC